MAKKKGSKDSCIVNIQKCTISSTSGQKKVQVIFQGNTIDIDTQGIWIKPGVHVQKS